MGRARSAIAARASQEALKTAMLDALKVKLVETVVCEDFDAAIDYCRPRCEELGGEEGCEAWYFWTVGDWTILGDLSMQLVADLDFAPKLSDTLGDMLLGAIDVSCEYALFGVASGGRMRRLLILEDEEIVDEGFPVKAEAGKHLDEFDDEEAERLWTSYGLPTFEFDPTTGPFECIAVQKI